MLKLYRDLKLIYFPLSIGGGLLLLFLMRRHLLLAVALAYGWVFVVAALLNRAASKRVGRVIRLMTDECRVREFIDSYEPLVSKCRGKRLKSMLLLNLSSGYLNLGDCGAAQQLLGQIPERFGEGRFDCRKRLFYYNNRAGYDLQVGNWTDAARMLDRMEDALGRTSLSREERGIFSRRYQQKRALLSLENGQYDAADPPLREAFESEREMLGKVFAKYYLGKLALRQNDRKQAWAEFAFAAQHGGDSVYAVLAREELDRLEREGRASV